MPREFFQKHLNTFCFISDAKVETKDGATHCKFSVPEKFTFTPPPASGNTNKQTFALEEQSFHLLLATGSQRADSLTYHDARLPSEAPASLTSVSLLKGAGQDYLIQIHGLLMVMAWLGLSSTGMVISLFLF